MVDFSWNGQRRSGVFLHISSLPSEFGVGNIGEAADKFFDFIKEAGLGYWQICPLGPTGYGDSPYQLFSSFAGNIYFIDYMRLVAQNLLLDSDLNPLRALSADNCDYGALYANIPQLLRKAYANFKEIGDEDAKKQFALFCKKNAEWLAPYALYISLKREFGGKPWYEWESDFRDFKNAVKQKYDTELLDEVERVKFGQWIFFTQYDDFKAKAKKYNVEIFGDLPIFLAHDSADVWSNPELFELNKDGSARNVAGVGPDYFSAEGQLWGNPLYDWKNAKQKLFEFWEKRIRAALFMYSVIRLDHFRGFADYWSIPAKSKDARKGKWKIGPGIEFFEFLRSKFPTQKFVAEDLGLLSKRACDLRDDIKMPAMAVLQFAFGDSPQNPYLPHNVKKECVYYTGTHDNNTACGWYESAPEKAKDEFRRYFRVAGNVPNWDMIHAVMMSVARLAIFPMQDILGLGGHCRTNTPGKPDGNWTWRMTAQQLDFAKNHNAPYLKEISYLGGRLDEEKNNVEIFYE